MNPKNLLNRLTEHNNFLKGFDKRDDAVICVFVMDYKPYHVHTFPPEPDTISNPGNEILEYAEFIHDIAGKTIYKLRKDARIENLFCVSNGE